MKTEDIYKALNQVMQASLNGEQDIEQGRLVINSATRATELFQAELRQAKLHMELGVKLKPVGETVFVKQ